MNLFLNVDTRKFQRSISDSRGITQFGEKRGDTDTITLTPVRNNEVYTIPGTVGSMVFAAKADYEAATPPLVLASVWTLDAETGTWSAPISQDVDEIATLLNGEDHKVVVCELTWTSSITGVFSSETVKFVIYNDVWKGTEGTPGPILDADDDWVAHGHAQTLTDGQQEQARQNIHALVGALQRSAAEGPPVSESWADIQVSVTPEGGGGTTPTLTFAGYAAGKPTFTDGAHTAIIWAADADLSGTPGWLATASFDGGVTDTQWYWTDGDFGSETTWIPRTEHDAIFQTLDDLVQSGTIAEAIGQDCIVGDNGSNKLLYKASQIEPTVWDLTGPAGVIEDPNNPGQFVRLSLDGDGAITWPPYAIA